MKQTIRTQQDIIDHIKSIAKTDSFGLQTSDLIGFLDYEHAKEFIEDGVTKEQWNEATDEVTTGEAAIRGYMEFAWDKANNRRGISAMRSLAHMSAWLWIDGKDELALSISEYNYYGKPQLVEICEVYGIDWKVLDDGEWVTDEGAEPKTAEQVLG
jgi:hypothetical protein